MSTARPDTWMPWYVGDYLRKTMHLDADEDGAYRRLIDATWIAGGLLIASDKEMARITKLPLKKWLSVKPAVAKFFEISEEGWRHGRVSEELAKAQAIMDARSTGGKRTAEKRWSNRRAGSSSIAEQPSSGLQSGRPSPSPSPSPVDSPPTGVVAALGADDIAIAVDAYNAVAKRCGLPLVAKLTDDRRTKLRVRLKEHGLDGWRTALAKLAACRWMHGDNERSWRANFDFLLQPSRFIKLLEGAYDRDDHGDPDLPERRRPQAPPRPEDLRDVG